MGAINHQAIKGTSAIRSRRWQTSSPRLSTKDFFIVYPASAGAKGLREALFSLYYLPRHFKLVVLGRNNQAQEDMRTFALDSALMGRVSFDETAGMAGRVSPFSYGDVIVSSGIENDPDSRYVNIAATPSAEAFASAVLKVARA